ncbi:MAG: hypothetical protein ABJB74_05050 [Gemmatimonas sp.]
MVPTRSPAPKCDADNGGITLPTGFCAAVFADKLGAARHMAMSAGGDLYVAMQRGRGPATAPGITVLRDTDGDGKADKQETFGSMGGGGIAIVYRPTGLLTLPDVSMLISDDKVGRIWKVMSTK